MFDKSPNVNGVSTIRLLLFGLFFVSNLLAAETTAEKKDIHRAVRLGDVKRVNAALRHGADINALDANGETPLMGAVSSGNIEIVKLLIAKGADIAYESKKFGLSAFDFAIQGKQPEIVRILLDKGVDVNKPLGNDQTSPLAKAAVLGGNVAILKILLEKGANINAVGSHQRDALGAAVGAGHYEAAEFLISKGANVNPGPGVQWAPINVAAMNGNDRIVGLLLDKGAKINATNNAKSALMFAVEQGHASTVKLLISRGADVNQKDNAGRTALSIANQKGKSDVVGILKSAGAKE